MPSLGGKSRGEIKHAVNHATGVHDATDVSVRWSRHRLHAELSITVSAELSVEKGMRLRKRYGISFRIICVIFRTATIHIESVNASGEDHHRICEHVDGDCLSIRIDGI